MAEKSPEANRGHANRSPGKKIAVIVERREEGDSQAAVGHGIQETMAGGGQKEITPERNSPNRRQASPEPDERHSGRQQPSEKKGVGESAVTPEVAVTDAESEPKYVNIGNDRAECPYDPDSLWRAQAVKTGPDSESCHRM